MRLTAVRADDLSHDDRRVLAATLQRAANLLRRKRWAKDAPARDALGVETDPTDRNAKAFCVAGAFLRTGIRLDTATIRAGMVLLYRAAREVSGGEVADLFELNDNPRTAKRNALAVLEHAAALAARERVGSPVARQEANLAQAHVSVSQRV